MNNERNKCLDNAGNIHYLVKAIKAGGQGIVYRTRDASKAVKLVIENDKEVTDEKRIIDYQKSFFRLRLLPVNKEVNITFPKTLLTKRAGYVMEFLSDMVSVDSLLIYEKKAEDIKDEEIPGWLKEWDIVSAKYIVAYNKTGGLRRRLLVLYKIASQLALLHGAGLVYCDISANNIFISGEEDRCNAWLIDADNLEFEGETNLLRTYGFAAPELVLRKSNCTMSSDCHAFAVLAYRILTMELHPFFGRKVFYEDWANVKTKEKPADLALEGRYPWVRDEDDDSNSSEGGFSPELLYDKEIANLFQKTFGKGRLDPSKRPPIFYWPPAFARAADSTIQCPGCKMSYRYDYHDDDGKEQCPHCGSSKPLMLVMEAYAWDGAMGERQWLFAREIEAETSVQVPARVFSLAPLTKSDIPVMEIEIQGKMLYFKKADDAEIDFSVAVTGIEQGQFRKLLSQVRFQTDSESILSEEIRFFIFAESGNCSRMVKCRIGRGQK